MSAKESAADHANGIRSANTASAEKYTRRKSSAPVVLNAEDLMARKFAPQRWAIHGLLPEGVTLLVGAPKVGKSWLALQFAMAIADAAPLWNGRAPEIQGRVLLLALEDNERRMQTRLAKIKTANTVLLSYATEWPRMDNGGLDHLAHWLDENAGATRLVVIDTLGRFRPPDTGRGSAYAQDYEVGAELKRIADKYKIAILLLHHTRKAIAADVLDSVSGTQGLTGSVDALLILRRERGQMDAALYVTGRDIEHEEDYALKFDSASCTWSALGRVHEVQRSRERQRIIEFLTKNGPSKPKDIAEGLGKNGSTTRVILKRMLGEGALRIENSLYTLTLVNAVNKVNSVNTVSVHSVDTVSPVYTVYDVDGTACPRCDGEGCPHCERVAA
jgi:hypothetical protein